MRKVFSILAAALLATTLASAGHGESGDWEFGPYVGYVSLDDYDTVKLNDEAVNPDDDFLFGGRVGYFFVPHWSLEASYQKVSTASGDSLAGITDPGVDLDAARLNVLFNFRPGANFRPFVTLGAGLEGIDAESVDDSGIGYNGGFGLRWFAGDHFALRIDGRYVYVDAGDKINDKQGNVEGTLGFSWLFGGAPPLDTDGDGVSDRGDKCPDTPHGATVGKTGCPTDTDGDGVFDGIDQCPDTPKGEKADGKGCSQDTDGDGVKDGPDACPNTPKGATVDAKGCPADADGDGVYDGIDQCPNTAKGAKVDAKGCPTDSDGDGVFDGPDQCANTAKGAKVDAKGCPTDGDGDGVYDGLDKCPDTPKGTPVDATGCTLKAAPLFTPEKRTLVLEGVNFATNKAVLTPESSAVLDKIAASLRDWPDVKVEVGGHTDSSGEASHNLKLSGQRAKAVVEYLVGKGIDASRITAKAYGEGSPIADNETPEGKAKNRRVELKPVN
jgi:outer membrane protein OmpA-like peptidoglycan-associated protein